MSAVILSLSPAGPYKAIKDCLKLTNSYYYQKNILHTNRKAAPMVLFFLWKHIRRRPSQS